MKKNKATIQKQVRRFDLGEMREATRTPQGFLLVPGFATRTGVFPYLSGDGTVRRELRHPDDVFDPASMATLKYAPYTSEHPPQMITPENVAKYSKGHTTERVEVNREMIDVDIIIEHQDAIDEVESGEKRELSSGYIADIVEEEGTYNGAPYNYRQINIRYNHLAGVKKGRAGPEVRMRLDSADAVMRTDEDAVPLRSEFSQESAVSDSDTDAEEMKTIVVGDREVSLPSSVADTIQDMFDRYDEMRAKQSELEEIMAKQVKRNDVDVNGPKASPQVKVEQQGPDGKSAGGKTAAGGKVGPGQKTVHPDSEEDEKEDGEGQEEQGGVAANSRKGDEEGEKEDGEESEEKSDFEAGPAGAGGGAAISPVDQLKKDVEGLHAKLDMLMGGKKDMAANATMQEGEAKPDRMDSKTFKVAVQKRAAFIRQAAELVPFETACKFDSMDEVEIKRAVVKHHNPSVDVKTKKEAYLDVYFDTLLGQQEGARKETREDVGRKFMRADAADDKNSEGSRREMIKNTREEWKQPLSANKK